VKGSNSKVSESPISNVTLSWILEGNISGCRIETPTMFDASKIVEIPTT
jgi:hypothetical protein